MQQATAAATSNPTATPECVSGSSGPISNSNCFLKAKGGAHFLGGDANLGSKLLYQLCLHLSALFRIPNGISAINPDWC
jgi:hypothetical protein